MTGGMRAKVAGSRETSCFMSDSSSSSWFRTERKVGMSISTANSYYFFITIFFIPYSLFFHTIFLFHKSYRENKKFAIL